MQVKPMQDEYVDVLKAQTSDIFEMMMGIQPLSIDCEELAETNTNEVVASLGFTGSSQGIFVLSTTRPVAETVYRGLMGIDESEEALLEEVADGIGEFLNMLVGNFKNVWGQGDRTMHLSIPQVALGDTVTFTTGRRSTAASALGITLPAGQMRIEARIYDRDNQDSKPNED